MNGNNPFILSFLYLSLFFGVGMAVVVSTHTILQGRAAVAHRPHKSVVVSSNLTPVTKNGSVA